jgi:hypothetical protein
LTFIALMLAWKNQLARPRCSDRINYFFAGFRMHPLISAFSSSAKLSSVGLASAFPPHFRSITNSFDFIFQTIRHFCQDLGKKLDFACKLVVF